VEEFSYAVATKGFVDSETWGVLSSHAGNNSADIAVEGAGLDYPALGL